MNLSVIENLTIVFFCLALINRGNLSKPFGCFSKLQNSTRDVQNTFFDILHELKYVSSDSPNQHLFHLFIYVFYSSQAKKTKQSLLQQVCALPFLYIHCGFAVFRTVHCQKQKKTHVAIVRNLALRSWSNRWVDHHNDITETQDGDEWLKYNDHLVSSSFDDYCQI